MSEKTQKTDAKTETEEKNEVKAEISASDEASAKKKKPLLSENTVEIMVAILLGVTALLAAWATWIGSLHGGNQSTNYTRSNTVASEGNSEYNVGIQLYLSDVMTWNTMMDYSFESTIAEAEGDAKKVELIDEKLSNYAEQNGSQILAEGIEWMNNNDADSPFDMPGITEKYFEDANKLIEESRQLLEEGKKDNAKGDAYNLVSVFYSVVLFMLGIVGIFKRLPNRVMVLIIAAAALAVATIYMCTIPLPTGFDIASFFAAK